MEDKEKVVKEKRATALPIKIAVYFIDLLILVVIAVSLLKFVGIEQKAILTGSMVPWVNPGDTVFVKECNIGEVTEGDVVCFTVGDNYVCHRVYSMNGDGTITTKGDAVQDVDQQLTTKDEFVGKVIFKLPKGQLLNQIFMSIFFKVFVVIMVILTFII